MDKPLLALTSQRRDGLAHHCQSDAAHDNVRELVQLRWLAVIGQLAAILTAHMALKVALPLVPMLAIVAMLAAVNVVIGAAPRDTRIGRSALLGALALDMAGLTAQLFLSGGTGNPFVMLYLLQVALGAILLPFAAAALLALSAAAGFALLSVWRLPLNVPSAGPVAHEEILLIANGLAFAMVAGLLVLFVVRISRNLRAQESYLAQLRERGAQEEGVLRVGLFASGAAHELGTPLSSLAVLVGDWRRHPAFIGDPQLQEELADAAAEIQRCKNTVSRVLASAGQTRGEAMSAVDLQDLLRGIAAKWAVESDTPLAADWTGVGQARITADPALPQAIWSLLENSREAHSPTIELTAKLDGSEAAIAVRDRGDGFSGQMLADVGKPFRTRKGRGRGIGLFLATTVARRLGGQLVAANRPDGGAVVTLRLPIVKGG